MYQVKQSFPSAQDFSLLFLLSSLPFRIQTGICMESYVLIRHNPYTHWGATRAGFFLVLCSPSHSSSVLCVAEINGE